MQDERDDAVQHGIDDNPNDDAEKGAVLGGVGGAVTGAIAGAMVGPAGALLGGAIGAAAGAVASGLGVAAVDRMDNDNTMTGVGEGKTRDVEDTAHTKTNRTGETYDQTAGTTPADAYTDTYAKDSNIVSMGNQGYVPEEEMSSFRNQDQTQAGAGWSRRSYSDQDLADLSDEERRYMLASDEDRARFNLTDDQRRTLKLREEQLTATKRPVEAGEVTLHKEVVTENKTINVPTTREEVVIERHPVSGQEAMDAGDIQPGEEIRVPVMREEVQVQKTPVVTGEVSIGKRQVQENQTFTDTVRREEARIDNPDNVRVENADNLNVDVDQDEEYADSDTTTRSTNPNRRF